jgi:ADP-ribose pyrophosphatase YjhB (NUDIX family)
MKDILRDSDIFKNVKYDIPDTYEDRKTVKVIIQNEKGEVALITNPIHKIFLLPGGGAESNNLEQEAVRESLEEINYHVKIIEMVSEVEEFRNRNAKHYLTTCFSARALKEGNKDLRTEEEKNNGLEVRWFYLKDALKIMNDQVKMIERDEIAFYNTSFNIIRDCHFLEKFHLKKPTN